MEKEDKNTIQSTRYNSSIFVPTIETILSCVNHNTRDFIPDNDLAIILSDGVVLCQIVDKFFPNFIFEDPPNDSTLSQKEKNLNYFFEACKQVHVKPFHRSDLHKKKNLKAIRKSIEKFVLGCLQQQKNLETKNTNKTHNITHSVSLTSIKPHFQIPKLSDSSNSIISPRKNFCSPRQLSSSTSSLSNSEQNYEIQNISSEKIQRRRSSRVKSGEIKATINTETSTRERYYKYPSKEKRPSSINVVQTRNPMPVLPNQNHRSKSIVFPSPNSSSPQSISPSSSISPSPSISPTPSRLVTIGTSSLPSIFPLFASSPSQKSMLSSSKLSITEFMGEISPRITTDEGDIWGSDRLIWTDQAKQLFDSKITFERLIKICLGENVSIGNSKQVYKLIKDGIFVSKLIRLIWPPVLFNHKYYSLIQRFHHSPINEFQMIQNFDLFFQVCQDLHFVPFSSHLLNEIENVETIKKNIVDLVRWIKTIYMIQEEEGNEAKTIVFPTLEQIFQSINIKDIPSKENKLREIFKDGTILCKIAQEFCPTFSFKPFYHLPTSDKEKKYNFEFFSQACQDASAENCIISYDAYKNNIIETSSICSNIAGFVKIAMLNQRELSEKAQIRNKFVEALGSCKGGQENDQRVFILMLQMVYPDLRLPVTDEYLFKILKDGVILCNLVRKLSPSRSKIDFFEVTFSEEECQKNIELFLSVLEELGVPKFSFEDIEKKENIRQIRASIVGFGRAVFNQSIMKERKKIQKKSLSMTYISNPFQKELSLIPLPIGELQFVRIKIKNQYLDISAEEILKIGVPSIPDTLTDDELFETIYDGVNLCHLLQKTYTPFQNKEFYFSTFSETEEIANLNEFRNVCLELGVFPFELIDIREKRNAESIRLCILNYASRIFWFGKNLSKNLPLNFSDEEKEMMSRVKELAINRQESDISLTPASDMADYFFEYLFRNYIGNRDLRQQFGNANTQLKLYSYLVNSLVHNIHQDQFPKKSTSTQQILQLMDENFELTSEALIYSLQKRLVDKFSLEEELLFHRSLRLFHQILLSDSKSKRHRRSRSVQRDGNHSEPSGKKE